MEENNVLEKIDKQEKFIYKEVLRIQDKEELLNLFFERIEKIAEIINHTKHIKV